MAFLLSAPLSPSASHRPYCDSKPDAKGSFSDNFKEYKINVLYDENTFKNIDDNTKNQIIKIIEQDPKPAYKQDKKEYKFLFSDYEICFEISENTAKIIEINKMQL